MRALKTGQKAPQFELNDQNGKPRSLKDLCSESKYLVLYFYPKDLTPGCTVEAQEFSRDISALKKLGAAVVGVSGGDAASKEKFCKKHNLKFTLLADEEFSVAKKFGAYGEKKFMGRSYMGIHRKTFVINSKGQISHIYPEVKPEGHAEEVRKFLAGIGKKFEKGRSARVLETSARAKKAKKTSAVSRARTSRGKLRR